MVDTKSALTELHRRLIMQLAGGHVQSGNEMARQFGVSRAGIWKAVQHLKGLGLEIHACSGSGYRLDPPFELLNEAAIKARLHEDAAGLIGELHIHDLLESTNACLMQASRAGATSGAVCLAETQTRGRGRLGRSWQSPLCGNVYLSVLWRFPSAGALGGLSLVVGTLLVRILRSMGVPELGLKWPNDLVWNEKKLGGILLEVSGEVHGGCAVVIGIGINCSISRDYAAAIDQAVIDLRQIRGAASVARDHLIGDILNVLLPSLAAFESRGWETFMDEWRQYHWYQGRRVVVDQGTQSTKGIVAGVTSSGSLLLDCEDGRRREFSSGDLRLRADRR